jgi:hypothetical protein
VKLLLTSIDDVEMRRLKEGFYSVMKLANAVKDKGETVKDEMRIFVKENKIEKPQTDAIIQIAKVGVQIENEVIEFKVGEADEEVKKAGKGKKAKKQAAGMQAFKKKLQLKLGAGEGNGDKGEEEKVDSIPEEKKKEEESNEESKPVMVEPIKVIEVSKEDTNAELNQQPNVMKESSRKSVPKKEVDKAEIIKIS